MNFWTPDWCADHLTNDSDMPWYTRYEYVKAYDYLGVENGEDQFQLRWEDNFDGTNLDTDRWALSTHSNHKSTTTFVPENAYLEEGKLVLKMEHKDGQKKDEPEEPKRPNDGHYEADWQVLPPPKKGTLDATIEKSVRVGVKLARTALDSWSESMGHLQ